MARSMITPKVGDVVLKEEWGGGTTYVEVTAIYDDVKNGEPGFSGIVLHRRAQQNGNDPFVLERIDSDANKWGYNYQIRSVVYERGVVGPRL